MLWHIARTPLHLDGGRKQIFLVACAANVPENRTMVKLFFKEMKVKDLVYPFILVADEKMKNLMFGKKLNEIILNCFLKLVSRYSEAHLASSSGLFGGGQVQWAAECI